MDPSSHNWARGGESWYQKRRISQEKGETCGSTIKVQLLSINELSQQSQTPDQTFIEARVSPTAQTKSICSSFPLPRSSLWSTTFPTLTGRGPLDIHSILWSCIIFLILFPKQAGYRFSIPHWLSAAWHSLGHWVYKVSYHLRNYRLCPFQPFLTLSTFFNTVYLLKWKFEEHSVLQGGHHLRRKVGGKSNR